MHCVWVGCVWYVEGEGEGGGMGGWVGVCVYPKVACVNVCFEWRIKNLINMSVIKAEYLSSGVMGRFLCML